MRCLFVHLGKNAVIRSNAVIAIIDWDTLWASDINQSYLERVKKNQRIQDI